jgi:hypothetical protein
LSRPGSAGSSSRAGSRWAATFMTSWSALLRPGH